MRNKRDKCIMKMTCNDELFVDAVMSSSQYLPVREEERMEEKPSWKEKPLHNMYPRQTAEVAYINKSYLGWKRLV